MRQRVLTLLLVIATTGLSGCLFSVNHPQVTDDGAMVVFLERGGGYTLFSEGGALHILRDGEWTAVPGATLSGAGGLFDLSPDGTEALYVDVLAEDLLEQPKSALYRVGLQPDAVPEAIWETENAIAKAVWAEAGRILLLEFGDGDLATLHVLDPATGVAERSAGDLLSFEVLPQRGELIALVVDEGDGSPQGAVVRWSLETDVRETLASFALNEASLDSFIMLPHQLFWGVSPDGAWVALSLYDSTLIEPEVEAEAPSLYLIDVAEGEAQRIAAEGLMPTFNPDGTGLVYAAVGEEESPVLMWRNLQSGRTIEIPGTAGVSTAFWLSPTRLGMTFEAGDDRYRLLEFDLITEQTRELIGAAPGDPDEPAETPPG
jgi:hypothetical protein